MRRWVSTAAASALVIGGGLAGERALLQRWAADDDGAPPFTVGGPRDTITTDDGATLSAVRLGDGPVVVLAHGYTNTASAWSPVADLLVAAGRSVVLYDQRGHGSSTVGRDGFGVERLGRDMAAVLGHYDVRDAIVGGHSMGGLTTLVYGIDHADDCAERVRRLVPVAPLIRSRPDPVSRASARVLGTNLAERVLAHPTHGKVAVGLSSFGKQRRLSLVEQGRLSSVACASVTRRGALSPMLDFDRSAELSRIPVPVTVLCGTLDRVTPLRSSRSIVKRLADGTLHELADAGHMVLWERSAEVADLLLAM